MPAPRFVPPPSQSVLPVSALIPTQRQAPPPELAARPAPPASRPAAPARRRTIVALLIALGTSAGLLVGLIVGSVASAPPKQADANAATAIPAGGGRYRVGPDLTPGIYQTSGENGSSATGCYYARLKTGDGSLGDIIDNYVAQGPMTVTVGQSDGYFETTGCSPWTKIG
ncbi:hypothetical protein [Pseudonocardia sp.]|jgi:hypothetical protein|uniref:hypothetical protein n=1 Tax=Pseudonocardia sp. TaxID=60912 RepID=UPI002F41AF3B